MLAAQETSCLESCFIYALAIDPAVRTGEVNVLENTHVADTSAMCADRRDPLFIDHDDLTRLNVALVLGADSVKCAGLRREHIGVADPTHAERFESVRISRGDQFLRAHDQKRISALDLLHRLLNSLLDGRCSRALFRDEICDDLRVNGRLEERALLLEFLSQGDGIREVAVMCEGKCTLYVLGNERLRVLQNAGASRGISDVSDGDRALEGIDHVVGKHLTDQTHVLLAADPSVVIDSDAAAFLASVLQREKTVVNERGDLKTIPVENTKNTAFFMS